MRTLNARSFALPIVICLMVLLVDALWIRLQYWLVGGFVLPAAALKPLIALASISGVLALRRRLPRRPITLAALVMLAALVLNFANLVVLQGVSVRDVLISHNAYYWPFVLLPLVLVFRDSVPEVWFDRVLLWVGVPLAALGLLQFVLQRPLFEISLPEASFTVNAWRFHGTGQVRAFSLFGSGQTFGYLLAPLAAFLTVESVRAQGRRRLLLAVLLAVVLAVAVATLTRNTYLVVALTLIGTFCYLTTLRRWTWFVPLLYHLAAGVVIAAFAGIGVPGRLAGLLDTTSLGIRVGEWGALADRFTSSGPLTQLLGLGLIQSDQVDRSLRILVDNSFFAVLLQHGWIGLISWMGTMWVLWMYLHRRAIRSRSATAIAMAAAFSTWPIVGLFNVTVALFAHLALIAILVHPASERVPERSYRLAPPADPVAPRVGPAPSAPSAIAER